MPNYCYVYVLRSLKDHQFYVGLTRRLPTRVQQHNDRLVTSTSKRAPFELVYWEGCLNESDAAQREKYLKTAWASDTSKSARAVISRGKEPAGLTSSQRRGRLCQVAAATASPDSGEESAGLSGGQGTEGRSQWAAGEHRATSLELAAADHGIVRRTALRSGVSADFTAGAALVAARFGFQTKIGKLPDG